MKRNIFTFLISAFCLVNLHAQNIIDINDVKALINNNGTISFDGADANFEVPEGSGNNTIFDGQLWLGGLDDSDSLHLAAQTYNQSGYDFWAGPIATDYDAIGYDDKYNRVWIVNKSVIDNHKLNWSSSGYVVPEEIADWPAQGDITNGEAEYLAPFYDFNDNSIYDPENGDYPIIRGDEALFFIMNDDADNHSESGGEKIGIEIHGMAYAFNAPETDTALSQTLFLHYEIFNRSINNYHDFYIGSWMDFDIGCYTDDWVGCDSTLNLFYAYNGASIDNPCPEGYGEFPPAQGVVFLNENLSSFVYYNNDVSVTGNPEEPDEYYNYLMAIWKDDTHITYGSTGYGGLDETNFMFPSDPLMAGGWSELTSANVPSDRRGLGASGPFSLVTGASLCYDLALPFAHRDSTNNSEMVSVLKERSQDIIDFYNETYSECNIVNESGSGSEPLTVENGKSGSLKLYPNPVNDYLIIEVSNINKMIDGRLTITNSIGEIVIQELNISKPILEINSINLPEGIYLYQITDESNLNLTGSFTIQ